MTALQAVGWALVHSLWQAVLVAAALAVLLRIVPARAARTRYALALTALLLAVALPLRTALRPRDAAAPRADAASITTAATRAPAYVLGALERTLAEVLPGSPAPRAGDVPLAARWRGAFEPALPWVVAIWLAGVLALSLRLTSGWRTAQRLGTVGTRPAPPACAEALARLAARLRITRPVRVLESVVVQVPAVIGWLRPVVLLPASALTGLTPLQLDALLAHELAHVRRGDYLVNLVQSVIETLLFYHPAVWWVSRRVREEREHCCDDLAVAVCGDAFVYAGALAGMEGLRVSTPAFAMGAGGGSLLGRIRRLVAPATPELFPRWSAGLAAVTLALSIGGGAGFAAAIRPAGAPAIGTSPGPRPADATTDSLLARIRSSRDADARQDAVERLGRRGDPTALAALLAIAREDRDADVRREAVQALGQLHDAGGPDSLVALLEGLAGGGFDADVEREAVETLAELRDPRGLTLVERLARTHANAAVRRKAIDEYAEGTAPEVALRFLQSVLATDRSPAALSEALEELADLPGGAGRPALVEAARAHRSAAVRTEARRMLAEEDDRD